MTPSRRTINVTANYKLETLKEHFQLSIDRSHRGRTDVELERLVSDGVTTPEEQPEPVSNFIVRGHEHQAESLKPKPQGLLPRVAFSFSISVTIATMRSLNFRASM